MPSYKAGVNSQGLSYEVTSKFDQIDRIHRKYIKRDAIITSCLDGKHSKNSLHYNGNAIDLRTVDMGIGKALEIVNALKAELGSHYDIVLESDHIHLEYDPK